MPLPRPSPVGHLEPSSTRGHVRIGILAVAVFGFLVGACLVIHYGAREIIGALVGIRWGMLAIVAAHFAQVWLSGRGWYSIGRLEHIRPARAFVLARWISEAVGGLLPLTQLGGEVIAVRIVALHGATTGLAVSTLIADLGAQIASQVIFTGVGLAMLLVDGHQGPIIEWAVVGLGLLLSVLPAIFWAARRGVFQAAERLFTDLAGRVPALRDIAIEGLHDSLQRIMRQPIGLLLSFNAHLLSWLIGAIEIWVILYFLGSEIDLREAVVLESLSQVIRGLAFAIPGSLGVQEGGLILLGAIYGLSPQICLALSLAKRARELLLGIPALLIWQYLEGRRWWAHKNTLISSVKADTQQISSE